MAVFEDPFAGKRGTYQFTMSHLEHGVLFRDEEDYVYGVNSLAIGTLKYSVSLLGYTLMSNHFHLLLSGTYTECENYFHFMLRRLIRLLSKKYGVKGLIKADTFNVTAVLDRQTFVNELAYLLRNAYRARLASPHSYRWSSADVYFNPFREQVHGISFCTLTQEQKRVILRSHENVPGNWEHANGCILNRFFVDYQKAEKILEDSVSLFDKLRLYDLESAVKMAHGLAESMRFSDSQLQEKIALICRKEYHVESVHQLDRKSLFLLARSLSRRFAATRSQLRRLLGLTDDMLDKIL